MGIFVTGGSGHLGKIFSYQLQKNNHIALRYDVGKPSDSFGQFIEGSILDRVTLHRYANFNVKFK